MRTIGTAVFLFVLWLLMSGLFEKTLIVGLGLASSILAVYVARRMDTIDGYHLDIKLKPIETLKYNVWLLGEIAKANWAVTKLILTGAPLRQHLFFTQASQRTDLGLVVFANSITLTPGTISVEGERDGDRGRFLVHALDFSEDDHDALADMDARVSRIESGGRS